MTRIFDMVRGAPRGDPMQHPTMRKMTGAEISDALNELGLTVDQFSRIIGARYRGKEDSTVIKWLEDRNDAPYYLPALFALLKLPRGVETAERAAERYIVEEDRHNA